MPATICVFPQRQKGPQPWTNDELAELYRVVDILARAGLAMETDMGMSDEGDPWFVFCRADTGDVIAHFARIDGQFVAASVAVDETYKGANFRQIVDQMVRSQPLILPPPSPGTRLFLHPAVILTAFVATALAYSEKAMAADLMRPVEAKWDHHPGFGGDHAHGKAVKPSWFDAIQTMFRSPVTDGKVNHEADSSVSGSGQGISLASLIAIAMSAMQPFVDKMSFISEAVAAEPHGQLDHKPMVSHAGALAAAADLPIIEQSAVRSDDVIVVNPDAQGAQPVRKDGAELGPTDSQKIAADAHASAQHDSISQSPFQKAPVDDAPHKALPTDGGAEAYVAAVIPLQKTAAAPAGVHTDGTKLDPGVVSVKDVSPEALQVLNIHVDANGDIMLSKHTNDAGAADNHGAHLPVPEPAPTPQAPQGGQDAVPAVIHYSTDNGNVVLNAIASFVESGHYDFTNPLPISADLQSALAGYADASHPLKVIVFDSTSLKEDIFPFTPGVVFVEEKYFTGTPGPTTSGGHVVLDLSTGGSVTLVGVTTIDHFAS